MNPAQYNPGGESTIPLPTGGVRPNKIEEARKTFWFQRFDGSVFCTYEEEAWKILNGRIKRLGPVTMPPRLVGVSDGTIYRDAVVAAHKFHSEGKMEEAQQSLREGYNKEYESGLGKLVMPRNFDIIDERGNPTNILLNGGNIRI